MAPQSLRSLWSHARAGDLRGWLVRVGARPPAAPIYQAAEPADGRLCRPTRAREIHARLTGPGGGVQADVNVGGGILVIPGTAPSKEAWLEEARAIEAEHETGE